MSDLTTVDAVARGRVHGFLGGGGEMGARIRGYDWDATPLGPPSQWPLALRGALGICLTSSFPTAIYWGPELRLLYNDAWAPIPANKHPWALGRPAKEVWADIWDIIEPQLQQVIASGQGLSAFEQMLPMQRGARIEETYWNYSFTPIRDENGDVVGVFNQGNDITAEVLGRRERQAQVERLSELFQQAPGAVALLAGPRHVYELANPAYRELIGQRDPIGQEVATVLPEVVGQGFIEVLDRAYASGEPFVGREMPVSLRRGGGDAELRLLDFVFQPIRNAANAVSGIFVQATDVTDLKRAQAAQQSLASNLAEERARLKTLVDSLPVGVCFIDAKGTPVLSNPAYRRFVPDDRLPSMTPEVAARWHGVDEHGKPLRQHRFPVARALRGESVPGIELLYRGHREERWTRVSAVPLLNAAGNITAVLTVVVDIDEQKRAQETLQRLNDTLENEVRQRTRERDRIWQVSEDLLGVADANGVWLTVNPAWTRSLGWEAEEIVNKTTAWIELADSDGSTHERLASLSDGETFSFESRLRARGGERRVLSWRGVRVEGAIYSVARDVTEKRVREAALEHMQAQLRQSQKMEAVGQLTGGIAHDFNNLLTGIIGSLDLMQTRLAQGRHEGVDRYAKAAISSANRAAALTHRLLAFSRRQPLDPHPVAANALLASMEDMLRRTMGERIQLDIVTSGALWLTRCDANQLENAVLNLAINARDAMPNGGRMVIDTCNVTLDAAGAAPFPGLRPGQYVCISVSDTGVGMSPEVLVRAYEPFFTTKPIGQGTGLGLSMIYGFAKQSEGYTRIESQLDVGTTVRIYLPRYLGEIASAEESPNASGRYRAPRLRTVLVVEDETVVRNLVVEVLSDLGYRVLEAANGRTGLELLKSDETIDLVVSDVGLPELNGREMIDSVREHRPGLKVLFITGYAENANFGLSDVDQDMQLITKPVPLEILAQRIREMIGD